MRLIFDICQTIESLTLTKTDRITITQRIKIIKTYYKNSDFATATYRALRGDYILHNCQTMQAFGKIVKKLKETGVFTNIKRPVHHGFACFTENVAIMGESVAEDPNVSIPRRSQDCTLWRILHLDLYLHP